MKNKQWLDILIARRQLDPDCKVSPIEGKDGCYLVEGIDIKTSVDEFLLVCDCTSVSPGRDQFPYQDLLSVIEKNHDPYLVLVFNNWEHERQIYWSYYATLQKAVDKKQFTNWYGKKLSIYVDSSTDVILKVGDRGINYLKYPEGDGTATALRGKIYNVSFYELKKLYNVTGTHLFASNVRYGLQRGSTGETLKSSFREYISGAVYKRALELCLSNKQLDALKEALDVDYAFIPYIEGAAQGKTAQGTGTQDESGASWKEGLLLPENFWFYHNGVSIFVDETDLATPADQIILHPNKVSVINGAQTLTNFFLEAEMIERLLQDIIGEHTSSASDIVNSIIKTIFVKTIFIYGDGTFIRSITHGLNTQIPVLEESLLADSPTCDEVNGILKQCSGASTRLKILKDGEFWTGPGGLDVISFVKHWLVIDGKPGRSKNYWKTSLQEDFRRIRDDLRQDTSGIQKLECLLQIYQWWENAPARKAATDGGEAADLAIEKYGKNYFGSYVLAVLDDNSRLDDATLELLYERFIRDLKVVAVSSEIPIAQEAFKRDDLSRALFDHLKHPDDALVNANIYPATIEQDLKVLLNQAKASAYAFSKPIMEYLLSHRVDVGYFRVISRSGGKCREAFPFPNSTFDEIVDSAALGETIDPLAEKYLPFECSAFAAAIKRVFPVFVIDKDDPDTKHFVSEVHFIPEFSFGRFEKDARAVYEQTVLAFQRGEESEFPRSSEDRKFHIRPKAINAEDTFQFTNGNYITKRSFWANKKTVDALIDEYLNDVSG